MCFDPPVGASNCPPKGVYLVQQVITEQCYEKPSEELALCDYLSLVTPIVGGPFPYPFNAQVTVFNTGQLPPAPPPALPPQVVSNHAELQALINDQLIATAEQEGIYPFSGATVTVSGPDTVRVDGVQILLQGMNQLVPPVFVSLQFRSLDLNRTSATSLLPFTEQNCQLTTLDAERWLKIICSNGAITWFDIIRCEFGTPPPGLELCVEGAGVDVEYQLICIDGTTQLTRADLWQDGSLLSSLYLDESGAIVPTPVGVITVGACSLPSVVLEQCYKRNEEVIAICQYNAEQVIAPPNPEYPFTIEVTSINWTGGGGISVLPSQVVSNDAEADQAVLDMATAIFEANNFLAYPLGIGTEYRYNGGIPNNGYFTKLTVNNVDFFNNPLLDYTVELDGSPTTINFSVTSCVGLELPDELWKKITFDDGSILWFDVINCEFGEPLPGLVLCPTGDTEILCLCDVIAPDNIVPFLRHVVYDNGEVHSSFDTELDPSIPYTVVGSVEKCTDELATFLSRSKELSAGEVWPDVGDITGILQSVTYNIEAGDASYVDPISALPTTYSGSFTWAVNGAIANEQLTVGTMTVGIGGVMKVQWTERV